MSVLATPANMKKYAREPRTVGTCVILPQKPIAFSRNTEEMYSADAGDYWNLDPEKPLLDSDGEPMILVFKATSYIDADDFLPNV